MNIMQHEHTYVAMAEDRPPPLPPLEVAVVASRLPTGTSHSHHMNAPYASDAPTETSSPVDVSHRKQTDAVPPAAPTRTPPWVLAVIIAIVTGLVAATLFHVLHRGHLVALSPQDEE